MMNEEQAESWEQKRNDNQALLDFVIRQAIAIGIVQGKFKDITVCDIVGALECVKYLFLEEGVPAVVGDTMEQLQRAIEDATKAKDEENAEGDVKNETRRFN